MEYLILIWTCGKWIRNTLSTPNIPIRTTLVSTWGSDGMLVLGWRTSCSHPPIAMLEIASSRRESEKNCWQPFRSLHIPTAYSTGRFPCNEDEIRA